MKFASRLAQQRAIGRVPHLGMFEEIRCMRRRAPPEQQTSTNDTIKLRTHVRFAFTHHRSQDSMRKLPTDRRRDPRHRLSHKT
jgi:hypothetical protein